jgi:hypothetical protein
MQARTVLEELCTGCQHSALFILNYLTQILIVTNSSIAPFLSEETDVISSLVDKVCVKLFRFFVVLF